MRICSPSSPARSPAPAAHVRVDPRYYRHAEVEALRNNASKARTQLGRANRDPLGPHPTDLRLVFALLRRSDLLRTPLRHVTEVTGISLGKVSATLRTLSALGFVQTHGKQLRLRDSERLLQRWEVSYLEVVRPRLHPSTWCLAPGTTLEDLHQRALDIPDVLIGGEFAADTLTQVLKPGSLTLHTVAGGTTPTMT